MRTALLALLLSAGLAGCAEKVQPKIQPVETVKPPVAADYEHRVTSGESLAKIAAWYTGSAKNAAAIKAANPGLKPNRLKRGEVIIIPGPLVTRREPLPRPVAKENKNIPKSVTKRGSESAPAEDTSPSSLGDTGSRDTGDADIVEKSLDVGSSKAPVDAKNVDSGFKREEVPAPPPTEVSKSTSEDLLDETPPAKNPPAARAHTDAVPPPVEKTVEKAPERAAEKAPSGKAEGNAAKPATGGSDAEREKLLDELLSQ